MLMNCAMLTELKQATYHFSDRHQVFRSERGRSSSSSEESAGGLVFLVAGFIVDLVLAIGVVVDFLGATFFAANSS